MIVSESHQKRFQEILNAIQLNPYNFDMSSWFNANYNWTNGTVNAPALMPDADPECGTTLCIAGWAVHQAGYVMYADGISCKIPDAWEIKNIELVARDYLGLEGAEADWLFTRGNSTAIEYLTLLAKGGQIVGSHIRGFRVEMEEDQNG